jgi:hypothetical protein
MPPTRRLDDRIRELCMKAVSTKEPAELTPILADLLSAIHKRVKRLRIMAIAAFAGKPDFPRDRRKAA